MKRILFVTAILLASTAGAVPPPVKPAIDGKPAAEETSVTQASLSWTDSLAAGLHAAQQNNRTMLVVAGSTDCPWCEKLAIEFRKQSLVDKLKARELALVHVDIEAEPAAVRTLAVGPIPALRLMSPRGGIIASHDGYLTADELAHWLDENLEHVATAPAALLTDTQPPDLKEVSELIGQFKQSDPLVREAALRRLAPHPKLAAAGVSAALEKGNLATRLTALELLDQWHAPLAGLDPWRPESFTKSRQKALDAWATSVATAGKTATVAPPTTKELEAAAAEIGRLADLPDGDAEALCERLARFHAALLPRVIAEWKAATSDRAKQRLLTLRYRLVASDLVMLTWPGGLARLASSDASVRHKAAQELVERATADDQSLLLELFKDPDPLVREISLRGLQHVSPGQTGGELAKLLDDPDPNVRAAVLKQLADDPSAELAAKVAAYASREKDPDLLVHALRYLKGMPRADSVKAAIGLLKHPNWQVRAEAVDALSGLAGDQHLGAALQAEAAGAMSDLMDDPEPFVISRVFHGLIDHQINVEADRLEKAADKHPELTADVISLLLGRWHSTSAKDLVVMRTFFKKPDPAVRSAILAGLSGEHAEAFSDEIVASLGDKSPEVRTAAANMIFKAAEHFLEAARSNRSNSGPAVVVETKEEPSVLSQLLSAIGSPKSTKSENGEPSESVVALDPSDQWLARFRKGNGVGAWLHDTAGPLTKLLDGTPGERLAAATALVALGEHDDRTLPMLKQILHDNPASLDTIARILPWLTWSKREEWFNLLTSLDTGHAELQQIVTQMVVWPDARAAALLWKQLAPYNDAPAAAPAGSNRHGRPRTVSDIQIDAVYYALQSVYPRNAQFGEYRPAGVAGANKDQRADLKRRAEHGGSMAERVVALALLCELNMPEASEAATAVAADPKATADLRQIAFKTLLLAGPPADATAAAVKSLESQDEPARRLAVLYLAQGPSALRDFGYGISIYKSETMSFRSSEDGLVPQAPKNLKPAAVRPLLKDDDPDTAAAAGYLLALLGEGDGLDALVRRWRSADADDTVWPLRVAAAISAIDEPTKVPVLEEIYKKLSATPNGAYYMKQFYWTIRSMHGAAVLKLRKRIRDEVGMENLR
jgi:HEAT repeat protein